MIKQYELRKNNPPVQILIYEGDKKELSSFVNIDDLSTSSPFIHVENIGLAEVTIGDAIVKHASGRIELLHCNTINSIYVETSERKYYFEKSQFPSIVKCL